MKLLPIKNREAFERYEKLKAEARELQRSPEFKGKYCHALDEIAKKDGYLNWSGVVSALTKRDQDQDQDY